MIRQRTWFAPWLQQLAVALVYGLGFWLLSAIKEAYWLPQAGLRFACLLLIPPRFWFALLAGETVALVADGVSCLQLFGAPWVILHACSPMILLMPIVALIRDRVLDDGRSASTRMARLLVCAVAVSAISAADSLAQFALARYPVGYVPPSLMTMVSRYLGGNYLGILLLVPVTLAIRDVLMHNPLQRMLPFLVRRRTLIEGGGLLAIFAAVTAADTAFAGSALQVAGYIVLFLPVTWLAWSYGWQGAAWGGAAASFSIVLAMPTRYDPPTMLALDVLAFGGSILLMLGARTSDLNQSLRKARESLLLARQEIALHERRMHQGAEELQNVQADMNWVFSNLLHRLRHFLNGDDQIYREAIAESRRRLYRLADSLSPREWRRANRPETLWTGPVAEVLEELGVAYDIDIQGDLSPLSAEVTMAAYRLGCEAVVYLLAQCPTDRIKATVTAQVIYDRWLTEVRISSTGKAIKPLQSERLQSGLGATGLGEVEMRNRAMLFDGSLRIEMPSSGTMRVSMALYDMTGNRQAAKLA